MKISYGIIVVDGMPFLKHQLNIIYAHAHEIIICEGGVGHNDDMWAKITGNRRSIDGTIEFIKSYPDPEHKIKFIQKDWQDKNKMCHAYSKIATGDIIWHIDVDEFVDPAHIDFIKKLYRDHKDVYILSIPNLVFWGDMNTIIEAKSENGWFRTWFNFERIFRRIPGKYIHHLPTRGYYDPNNKTVMPDKKLGGQTFTSKEIYTYHFSYVLPSSVRSKILYYNHRTPNCIKSDWYKNVFLRFAENKKRWMDSDFDVQPLNPAACGSFRQRLRPLGHKLPAFLEPLQIELKKIITSQLENYHKSA